MDEMKGNLDLCQKLRNCCKPILSSLSQMISGLKEPQQADLVRTDVNATYYSNTVVLNFEILSK